MNHSLVLLWLAAIPLMGSPGPATLSLAGAGSAFGFRASLLFLLGIIGGTISVLLIVATGVFSLLTLGPESTQIITFLAAAYILFLAWKIAVAPVAGQRHEVRSSPRFISGFVLSVANPKAYAAIGAVYSGHIIFQQAPMLDAITKVANLSAAIVVIAVSWLAFGTVFSRVLRAPLQGRIANIVFAVMLVVSVLGVLTNS